MQNVKIKKIKSVPKKHWWAAVVTVVLVATIGIVAWRVWSERKAVVQSQDSFQLLSIKQANLRVELAKTPEQHRQGLCCRDSLPVGQGMLFIYDTPGDYRFWMKDTRIPLDIIWINQQKSIVHIEPNVQPASFPQTFGADGPAMYVLEANAGFAKTYGLQLGDKVRF